MSDTRHAATIEALVASLAETGWCITPGFLNIEETARLRNECLASHASGAFHAAGVGSGQAQVINEIRGDQIFWLHGHTVGPATQNVLAQLETLRTAINASLFLGLFDAELHYAIYPPGSGYQRHLDRFREHREYASTGTNKRTDQRTLTIILYLNPPDWAEADGGQLRFWPEENGHPIDILPSGGTLVAFLSAQFWHEVRPAQRQRLSLTGWFRQR